MCTDNNYYLPVKGSNTSKEKQFLSKDIYLIFHMFLNSADWLAVEVECS